MIKYIHATCIFVAAAISIALSQPKLSLEKPEINLGPMYGGMKKLGTIVLKNIGNDTLRILSVVPQCGCTTIKQPKAFLLPNESDAVEVEFNASGYRGKVEKYINITTNDITSQNIAVKLITEVKEELEPINRSVLMWFGNITFGQTSSQSISFKNVSGHPLKILNVTASAPTTSVKADKRTLNPNDIFDVQVIVKAEKVGYNNDHFIIETDSKNQPHIEIKVSYMGVKES